MTVMVEVPEPLTEVGLKLAVAPVGKPLDPKVTAPLKPPVAETVTVEIALLPWTTVCEVDEALREKSGPGVKPRWKVVAPPSPAKAEIMKK